MNTDGDPRAFDLRSNHDKMRALFQKFGRASGEEKKRVAREMMVLLPMRQR